MNWNLKIYFAIELNLIKKKKKNEKSMNLSDPTKIKMFGNMVFPQKL